MIAWRGSGWAAAPASTRGPDPCSSMATSHTLLMPRPIVERLNQEINQFTSSPEGSAKLAQFGMVHVKGGPDLLGTLMTAEAAKWKKVLEAAKVTIN